MSDKVLLNTEELEQQLAVQLQFLRSSAEAFDRGFEDEAKRLATTLRVLLHDGGRNSRSVLTQLDRKRGNFLNTAIPFDDNNILPHGGLVFVAVCASGARHVANLDDTPTQEWVHFDTWWQQLVFKDNEKRILTRKQLVLTVADQDGGAHVDPALDKMYYDLTRKNSLGQWGTSDNGEFAPLGDPARPAIRQIAHEALRSLDSSYHKRPDCRQASFIVGGMKLITTASPPLSQNPSPFGKIGRNAPCPCGSGKKYKHCHGKHA